MDDSQFDGFSLINFDFSSLIDFGATVNEGPIPSTIVDDQSSGLLDGHVDKSAYYNPLSFNHHPPICLPDTRTGLLSRLEDQVKLRRVSPQTSKPYVWLHGPAGSGKTAIMHSLCQRLSAKNQLLASFFFQGTERRNLAQTFIATLADQIKTIIPGAAPHIDHVVAHDNDIFYKTLECQSQLIVDPLRNVFPTLSAGILPHVIVIDGLDACTDPFLQHEILSILLRLAISLPFSATLIISSRLTDPIRRVFESTSCAPEVRVEDLREETAVDRDIHSLFESRLRHILISNPSNTPRPPPGTVFWPNPSTIAQLVILASGRFGIAKIIIDYVLASSRPHAILLLFAPPPPRLSGRVSSTPPVRPFRSVDEVYKIILGNISKIDSGATLATLLGTLGILLVPYKRTTDTQHSNPYICGEPTPHFVDQVRGYAPGYTRNLLKRELSCLLLVQGDHEPIALLHDSFREFLLDESRSENSHLEKESTCEVLLASLIERRFWIEDLDVREFLVSHLELLCAEATPSQRLDDVTRAIDFEAMESHLGAPSSPRPEYSWIHICGRYLRALKQYSSLDNSDRLYADIYPTFVATVRNRVQRAYLPTMTPELWAILCSYTCQGREHPITSAVELPSSFVDLDQLLGLHLLDAEGGRQDPSLANSQYSTTHTSPNGDSGFRTRLCSHASSIPGPLLDALSDVLYKELDLPRRCTAPQWHHAVLENMINPYLYTYLDANSATNSDGFTMGPTPHECFFRTSQILRRVLPVSAKSEKLASSLEEFMKRFGFLVEEADRLAVAEYIQATSSLALNRKRGYESEGSAGGTQAVASSSKRARN